ncbi:MAG: branched-chain amino acid ABC transporter permease [Actinomycetota bacterium]
MNRSGFLAGAIPAGAIGGAVIVYLCLVGMVEKFETLDVVGGSVTFNWILLLGTACMAAYVAVRPRVIAGQRVTAAPAIAAAAGAVSGIAVAAVTAVAIGLANMIGIDAVRIVLRSVSPVLLGILTSHMDVWVGTALLTALLVVAATAGGLLRVAPRRLARLLVSGTVAVVVMGLLQRIVPTALDQLNIDRDWLYGRVSLGLTPLGAAIVFVVAAAATWFRLGERLRRVFRPEPEPPVTEGGEDAHLLEGGLASRRGALIVAWLVVAGLLLVLPYLVGPVVSRILGTVGIFLLLGLGLNIVVGYAGLLDLGYVAFFSVGAYFMAILTGGQRVTFKGYQPPAFGANLSFWAALPIVVAVAALIGALIGAPVLRLRGDYLAIVTLGFGEIARVIFGSTWAQGLFGGALGMSAITKAPIPGTGFQFQDDPRHFYYLALFFCLLAMYVSWRLQDSRIGRAWNAMREDEQVADAMGISTIRYKLLAFAIGGAVGSIGGALFAVSLGSLTIKSFQILVSITALALIILGGLGSIPGVVLGALVLIGLPGVLSQFQEYRLLIYGAALIAIMLLRPQGLVPNVRRMRELREDERSQDQWAKDALAEEAENAPEPAGGELET